MKKITSLLLVLLLVCSLSLTPFAADSTVTYQGHNVFGFGPGSGYTATDLFDNFKDVMPGDMLTEQVSVRNTASCCDFIKVYMRAEVHDDANPLSATVAETESLASMQDFLSQLTMTVWNGDTKIYEGSPNEADGLAGNVLLGTFRKGQGTDLDVQLEVPLELGNDYSYRVGEVDWVFVIEEYDDATPTVPNTGDHSHILLYAVLMAASLMGILLVLLAAKKKKHAA